MATLKRAPSFPALRPPALFLAVLLAGCASGPPGFPYPGTGFVLHTREASSEAQELTRQAQEFLGDLGGYLRLRVPPGGLLRIYHYPNRWAQWSHLNREVPSLRWRRAVCYETGEAYVVTLYGDPERRAFQETLRHELTHYLVAAHFCDIPPWIDEGLSQVMASGPPFPPLERARSKEVRRAARQSDLEACRRLLLVPPGKQLTKSQYLLACAVTCSLLAREPEGAPTRLLRFLEATRPGDPPEQVFAASWGMSMEEACRASVVSQ